MDVGLVMELMSDALVTALKLSAPVLVVSVLVGLVVAIMQAATQVHEQTLTFVPKLVAIGIILVLLGPWMISQMTDFTYRLFDAIVRYV